MTLDEAIEQLRELNEPVPIPMRLPTPEEVAGAEQELGVKFHPDYRKYLLQASDVVFGAIEPATITDPDSHTHLISLCESAWEQMELPRTLLPICGDNGDYYCMNERGEVRFRPHDGTSKEKWRNLATWIEEVWIGENS